MQKLPYSTIVVRTVFALALAAAFNIGFVACTTQAENLKNETPAVFQGIPVDAAVTATGIIKEELEVTNSKPRLFIVQDISPQTLVLFEDYWNVDPEFFLDYLDLSTRAPTKGKRTVKPTPWYRLGDIEDHLPPLSSTNADIEHIIIRYIGPRELSDPNGNLPQPPVPDRLKSNLRNTYIERVGGGHNPTSAESNTFSNTLLKWISGYPIQSQSETPELHPIALIRHSAAAWFGKESDGQWNKGEPIY